MGSEQTFSTFANKINVKSEGEWRLCGTKLPLACRRKRVIRTE